MRRAGLQTAARREIKEAFGLLYRKGLNTAQALDAATRKTWSPEAQLFFDFVVASKKRGICAWLGGASATAAEDSN